MLQERVYQQLVQDVDELKRHLIDSWSSIQHRHPAGDHWNKRLISGELGWGHAFQRQADILNILLHA